ncbi:acetyltransferase [Petropleomorpha daqingensis]|uniref:Sugar O-acyltransferase (Sialic acid O-acetyltransferase NeuD family) n=1 Tax=Petropleomorpha daqingensis TaxID=2026353 RepID=A0A853CIH7_9ACTN|nr:acetyltransferase [Petropleomorpha daqingensis]NYJ06362.1 sugar O-acyltransferase (sialic acid O-acetyltransferase NeuD family) [Petropleomorpha daqingensis]
MAAKKPIVIVGAGETADIAYEYFTVDSDREVVAFSVERQYLPDGRSQADGLPFVAFEDLADTHPPAQVDTFVALSSTWLNRARARLFRAVKEQGYTCASFVSPHAFVWRTATVGENSFIFENNVLQHGVVVGDDVVLWSGNHIGHQTVIEDHVFIASHVVVSGFCRIGSSTFMGVNASVGDGVTIGADSVVGAGAVVVKDLPPRGVYVGSPAKPTGGDPFDSFKVPAEQR